MIPGFLLLCTCTLAACLFIATQFPAYYLSILLARNAVVQAITGNRHRLAAAAHQNKTVHFFIHQQSHCLNPVTSVWRPGIPKNPHTNRC